MNKHLFAIFTYFTAFFSSVFLVGLLTPTNSYVATSCFPTRMATTSVSPRAETSQQRQIRKLLDADQYFGMQYYAGNESDVDTANLVEKMESLSDISDLPIPVSKAYKAHTEAWDNYAKHLKNTKDHDESDRDCKFLSRQIDETYNILLIAAKNYGVDFPN